MVGQDRFEETQRIVCVGNHWALLRGRRVNWRAELRAAQEKGDEEAARRALDAIRDIDDMLNS